MPSGNVDQMHPDNGTKPQVDFEAEYNNRARVPEHLDIIAEWTRQADAYRQVAKCELDLAYGETGRTAVDVFHARSGPDDAPLALFIHGGYWQAMDRKIFSAMAKGLNSHGISVAVPSYDLCPSVTIGDIIGQMRACCAWLWERYNKPMTAFGHSAGGHLTAAMVATDWPAQDPSLPTDLCNRGYAISGVFELEPLVPTSLNKALGLDAKTAKQWSPRNWPTGSASRLTAAVGGIESDEFLRQSKDICAAWRDHGVTTAYREIDGKDHFTVLSGLTDPESTMIRDLVALVQKDAPKGP